jgi:phage shock protein PspC (stress-responsive transcriptional regulator)
MKRKLTMRERWQWLVALAALVVVVFLLLPLWATVIAIAFILAFAVPPLIHSRRRRRVRR